MNKRLVSARKKAGLSQKEVSEKLGVQPATVSGWECGARGVSIENAIELSKLYGVSFQYLCTGEDVGNYLSQAEFKLNSISGEEADEILQSLDMIATHDDEIYKDMIDDIFTIGRKLMAKALYSQK